MKKNNIIYLLNKNNCVMKSNNESIETMCVHSGISDYEFGAVVPPIYQVSTFKFKDADHGARLFKGEEEGYIYTRMRNPTIEAMENCIAELEGGAKSLGCASGMAATHTLLMALLESGDHVVCSESVYGPTTTLLQTVLSKFNINTTFVDSSNLNLIKEAITDKTKLIFIETPGNPTLVMSDIQAIAAIAHSKGIKLAVDNTFMSPVLQQPFRLGADFVVHSLTKFLNGHADVVGGVIVVKDNDDYLSLRKVLNQTGAVIDPFNAFLVHRGIKTLHLRMERHCKNAQQIAEYLEKHSKVKWVKFPGLESHPQYELGKRQMLGPGGMISFELKDGIEAGKILMNTVKIWQLAVSLGGVESLIQHPASMTHASMSKEIREQAHITDGLVRLSVGIENVEDLIWGLDQGLDKI